MYNNRNNRLSSSDFDYEEEMIQLASNMSLADTFSEEYDDELHWNPRNLDVTKEAIRMFEEIVDEQITAERHSLENGGNYLEDFGEPMSDSQIKDMFFQSPDLNPSIGSYNSVSSNHSHLMAAAGSGLIIKTPTGASPHPHREMVNRRPSGRGREQKIKDTVQSISGKLKWYQNKIVQTIESTNENDTLANLLELNDRVSSVLVKSEILNRHSVSSNRGSESSVGGAAPSGGVVSPTVRDTLNLKYHPVGTGSAMGSAFGDLPINISDIAPTVYALRRGSDRFDTLTAMDKLIKFCNFGGEVNLVAVKQMMDAGALQTLLSTLSRAGDWPDVELQISKVICVLVTYEDDWPLLQRSAYVILSSLYTLQLKTQARSRADEIGAGTGVGGTGRHPHVTGIAMENSISSIPSACTSVKRPSQSSDAASGDSSSVPVFDHFEEEEEPEDEDQSVGDADSIETNIDHHDQMQLLRQSLCEDRSQDVRALVSAAIAKVSLVLSCDWGHENPLASSLAMNFKAPQRPSTGGRSDGGRGGSMDKESTGRPRSSSNADSSKILEILLNLIVTMSESSLASMNQSGTASSLQHESMDSLFTLHSKSSSNTLHASTSNGNLAKSTNSATVPAGVLSGGYGNSERDSKRIKNSVFFPSDDDLVMSNTPSPLSPDYHKREIVRQSSLRDLPVSSSSVSASSVGSQNVVILAAAAPSVPPAMDPHTLPLVVDNATVLCSAALSNLSEIPQCRPGLVSGGALKIIKAWLEIGIEVITHARLVCFSGAMAPHSSSGNYKYNSNKASVGDVFAYFMRSYGTAYELISNAAAAMMYLCGGSDCRFQSPGSVNQSHMLDGNGGRDYIVGWIDAQILAEGIPAVIVKLISAGIEDFTTMTDPSVPTRSVLPAAVGMHLSQALFQLCSRSQNRSQLKAINIPHALCILFENVVSHVRHITTRQNRMDKHGDEAVAETIFEFIFNFNGIYYQNTHSSNSSMTNRDSHVSHSNTIQVNYPGKEWDGSNNDLMSLYSTSIDEKNHQRLSVNPRNTRSTTGSTISSNSGKHTPTPHTPASSGFIVVSPKSSTTTPKATGALPGLVRPQPSPRNADPVTPKQAEAPTAAPGSQSKTPTNTAVASNPIMILLSSITSSCLDALTYFFADEIAKMPYSSSSSQLAPPISTPTGTRPTSQSFSGVLPPAKPVVFLIDLMCNCRIIDAILLASSYLPRGLGRLATIRVISSLTEWPQSLKALYEGSVIDVLVLISSEADEVQAANSSKTITAAVVSDDPPAVFPPRPNAIERNTSNGSSISGVSSNSQHKKPRSSNGRTTPQHSHSTDDNEDEIHSMASISSEETLTVCYSLANLCEASETIAQRMFNSGLFMIMIKLVKSRHMEVSRQALRCMSAMCPVISNESIEKAIFVKPKTNTLFLEALAALTVALKSPSTLVQKGAVNSISQLALINSEIQDSIVEGPLRSIISLLVNPKNDRETRASAEEVLKNVGFLGGAKDFELCGFDFEILRDWYAMKRSLKPQDAAQEILKNWIEVLFSSEINALNDVFKLHHQRNSVELSAFGLANEAVNILQSGTATQTSSSIVTMTGSPVAHHSEKGASSSSHHLSIPHLQRNITDGIMKYLPFCIGKPAHKDEDEFPRSSYGGINANTSPISPPNSSSMNRSLHGASSSNANSSSSNILKDGGGVVDDNYDWIDRPPVGVTNLFDLFYSSRLHQQLLMDLTSLGVCVNTTDVPDDRSKSTDTQDVDEFDYDAVYLMPRPHEIGAILLPSREYQSFARVGRVLEKMIEYNDANKLWSLTFKESEFMGDFHTSLLSTLRRCSQIISLSFISTQRIEEDALLGHLVGQIPPSVRFLSFKSTLSRESIQALCILLRTQNAAFMAPYEAEQLHQHRDKANRKLAHAKEKERGTFANAKIDISNNKNLHHGGSRGTAAKGLIGLALTHLSLDLNEINAIVELLQTKSNPQRSKSFHKTSSSSSVNGSSAHRKSASDVNNVLPSPKQQEMRGLRFIDLSHNSLIDVSCARVLVAAMSGPCEGLELCGNNIHKGKAFIEAMEALQPEKMAFNRNRLRYLGLSQNNLTSKAVFGILHQMADNESITHLDLSNNEIDHSSVTNELLRNFLVRNVGLRIWNLCFNRLNTESFKEIHLGLLENESMLMLPLAGNISVDKTHTISLIQIKLRENRWLYKAKTKSPEALTIKVGNLMVNLNDDESPSPVDGEPTLATAVIHDSAIQVATVDSLSLMSRLYRPGSVRSTDECSPVPQKEGSEEPLSMMSRLYRHNTESDPVQTMVSPVSSVIEGKGPLPIDTPPSDATAAAVSTVANSDLRILNPSAKEYIVGRPEYEVRPRRFSSAEAILGKNNSSSGKYVTPAPLALLEKPTNTKPASDSLQPISVMSPGESVYSLKSNITPATGFKAQNPSGSSSGPHSVAFAGESLSRLLSEENVKMHNLGLSSASEGRTKNTLYVMFSAPLAGFDRNSKPHPLEVLDYSAERDILVQVFKEVHRDVCVHFDFATTDSLRTALSFGCKALHFSGHGIPKGLCFEDGRSGLQVIRIPQLKDLLGAGGLNLEFVFVSACFSKEIGEAFVKAGVPHVVCVKVDSKIQDAAAIAFTRAFYVAFLSGKNVKDSFDIAKEALKVSPYVPDSVLEGEKFILLPDGSELIEPGTTPTFDTQGNLLDAQGNVVVKPKHDKAIFQTRTVSNWPGFGHCTMGPNHQDVSTFIARNKLPAPPADFEGREVIMHSLISSIFDRRLVSLVGEDGVGKTSVASAVCKYIADRRIFPDGVVFVRAKGLKDYRSFLMGLKSALLNYSADNVSNKLEALIANTQQKTANLVYPEEELIFSCLESMKLLLVIDNLDDLLADYGESVTDLRLFLGRLFDQCQGVKILVVSIDTLSMHNVNVGYGIVEYSVLLGPLTLNSSLRLFARLAPSLSTAQSKNDFIHALQPPKQLHVSVNSRDINSTALQILSLFGDGHPAKIVHMACESTAESVETLKQQGMRVIRQAMPADYGLLLTTAAAAVSGVSGATSIASSSPNP